MSSIREKASYDWGGNAELDGNEGGMFHVKRSGSGSDSHPFQMKQLLEMLVENRAFG
jgi:hypothetical protein